MTVSPEAAADWTRLRPPDGDAEVATAADGTVLAWDRRIDGGAFVFDQPAQPPALWGTGDRVLAARGEPTYIVGPPGVGKTTLCQQLVLGIIGIRNELLGLPIEDDGRHVLYLALDRPSQIARSLRRMVHPDWRDHLAERLTVWRGPLPFDITAEPHRLKAMAEWAKAGVLIIDSLKDLSPSLEKPETGSAVNQALQSCVVDGIDVIALHHQRKASGDNRKPSKLADVYGSGWITAGAGSVLLLWGEAGDPVVELSHLKQPAETVGPWQLLHDHDRGDSTLLDQVDPLAILRAAPRGITARTLAQTTMSTPTPSPADVERARRRLERLVRDELATKQEGDKAAHLPALYLPVTHLQETP